MFFVLLSLFVVSLLLNYAVRSLYITLFSVLHIAFGGKHFHLQFDILKDLISQACNNEEKRHTRLQRNLFEIDITAAVNQSRTDYLVMVI